MPITIHIINPFSDSSNSVSAEETAAMQLKDKFKKELSGYKCKGDIFIFTNIRIFGQKRNDIDILVLGNFDDLKMPNMETKNHGKVKELTVKVSSSTLNIRATILLEYLREEQIIM